jgi:general secretion pathway protein I
VTTRAEPSAARPRRPRSSGFTLLEVMVALAVVATAFTALLGLHVRNLETAARDQAYGDAVLLARSLITMAEIGDDAAREPASGDFEEIYPGEYPGWRWERTLLEVPLRLLDQVRVLVVRVIPPLGESAAAQLALLVPYGGG